MNYLSYAIARVRAGSCPLDDTTLTGGGFCVVCVRSWRVLDDGGAEVLRPSTVLSPAEMHRLYHAPSRNGSGS